MSANWMFLTRTLESGESGPTGLLNLDCVQIVEIVSSSSLRLRFSETETVTIEGQPALDLVRYLMTKVIRFEQEPKMQSSA